MKRVLVIVPFPMTEENRDQRRQQLQAVELGPDIAFDFESVRAAPRNYVSVSGCWRRGLRRKSAALMRSASTR